MRHTFRAAVTILALAALPASALAQTTAAKPGTKPAAVSTTAKKSTTKSTVASHATTGVVKSMDTTSLVITHGGKNGKDMAFALNASTEKDGAVAVGSPVSVRYRQEGSSNIAMAVMLDRAKTASSAKTTAKK
jgi:hypothetical protein